MSRYLAILLSVIAFALTSSPVSAEEQPFPDTPAGHWLQAFSAGVDSGEFEAFAADAVSPSLTDELSPAAVAEFMRQVKMMHGGFVFHAFPTNTEYELSAIGVGRDSGMWRRFDISVEHEPPHRLTGVDISEADDPSEELVAMTQAEILDYVDTELSRLEADGKFSGAILIAKNDQPILEKAYGMASRRFSVPNQVDTKFNIGSINKAFTQLAIAQLMQQGKIDLQAKVSKYLPDFPKQRADKITVEHLISMRSGLSHYWTPVYNERWSQIRTVSELMEIIETQPLDFEPGTGRQYSNSGYVVLGAIIEAITGQDYYEYVREHIFAPAGMKNTDSYPIDQDVPNLAIGYTRNRSEDPRYAGQPQNNLLLHGVNGSPAGGGYSTLDDLHAFTRALRDYKLADARHSNLVIGFFEGSGERRPPYFGIAGGAPIGVCAVVEADFESGYTVIVLSNIDPPVAEKFGLKVMRMLNNQKDA